MVLQRFWEIASAAGFHLLPLTRCYGLRRWLLRMRGASVGNGARMAGGTRIIGNGHFHIGAETWLGPYALVITHPDGAVVIGARCDIAPKVNFLTGTHEFGTAMRRAGHGCAQPIEVGDGCWICAQVTILGGVRIGNGAIVAAGAVVIEDVAPHTLVGGVPAKLIKHLPNPEVADIEA